MEAKNTLIKNLTYSIHHATKAYNDAIRVYEAKLTEFGIPIRTKNYSLKKEVKKEVRKRNRKYSIIIELKIIIYLYKFKIRCFTKR